MRDKIEPISAYPVSELVQQAARVAFDTQRSFAQQCGEVDAVTWEEAPTAAKVYARMLAEHALKYPQQYAHTAHNQIGFLMIQDGWSWGPDLDEVKRESPAIKPFLELTSAQQFSVLLFHAVARQFAGYAGPLKSQ